MSDRIAPKQLFVQVLANGDVSSYLRNPKEVHDNGKPVYLYRLQSSNSYTLDELEQLARQWLEVPGDDDLPERLSLSNFLLWARKREREVGDVR